MDIYNENIDTIAEYIKSGSKGKQTDNLGIEIEHFTLDKNGCVVPYKNGIENVINDLSAYFEKQIYSEGFLIGLENEDYSITLEPGSQIEISIKPSNRIAETKKIYSDFISLINPILKKYSYKLVTMGYIPSGKAEDVELIPKKRYEYMNEYFKHTGKCGINMMRGTASVQVSIDFADEKDCGIKLKKSNALSPIFSLICDNSPVFEDKRYTNNILRSYIWDNVDDDRCGVFSTCLQDFSFVNYAEYIYNLPAILVMNGDFAQYTGVKKICDIYRNTKINTSIAEHILSMFFPDIRLKKYIEIRPADSMPIEYALSYLALIKGVFMSDFAIDADKSEIDEAKRAIMKNGYNAEVYEMNVYDIAMTLFDIAEEKLDEEESNYLLPLKNLVEQKQCPKEMF